MATLIDRIQNEILSDDEDREQQSEYLESCYREASEGEKKRIDECFIALCGYSLHTLIDQPENGI